MKNIVSKHHILPLNTGSQCPPPLRKSIIIMKERQNHEKEIIVQNIDMYTPEYTKRNMDNENMRAVIDKLNV